jgi:hypothetical protein
MGRLLKANERASEECKGDFASIAFRSKSKTEIGHGDRRS